MKLENNLIYYQFYLVMGKERLTNNLYYTNKDTCLQTAIERRQDFKRFNYNFDKIIITKCKFENVSKEIDHIYLYGTEAQKHIERNNKNERINIID